MIDAGSDVIDWVTALTWQGAGIAASLLIAVVVVGEILWKVEAARRRTKNRDKLIEFLDEGQTLMMQLQAMGGSISLLPEHANLTLDWAQRVEAYLQKHVGRGAAATFRNDTGHAISDYGLSSAIAFRMDVLHRLLEELRR